MHQTALTNAALFFETYAKNFKSSWPVRVLEIGSQDVNGSLRTVCPSDFEYLGVDFEPGRGVDLVLSDPYSLPFRDEEFDIVISSSCFEHSEMFWIVFLEIMRVMKPQALFYLNVPSNGMVHRYPVDCWRFYPDSGRALVSWAKRNNMNPCLLESYVSNQSGHTSHITNDQVWNDFVAVFLKDEAYFSEFNSRIINTFTGFTNGIKDHSNELLNPEVWSEDQRRHMVFSPLIQWMRTYCSQN